MRHAEEFITQMCSCDSHTTLEEDDNEIASLLPMSHNNVHKWRRYWAVLYRREPKRLVWRHLAFGRAAQCALQRWAPPVTSAGVCEVEEYLDGLYQQGALWEGCNRCTRRGKGADDWDAVRAAVLAYLSGETSSRHGAFTDDEC